MNNEYRIGLVTQLTGIKPETLRAWERRYSLVQPKRSDGGDRLYSQDDLDRLTLIKRLIDTGDAVSSLAKLSLGNLENRANKCTSSVNIKPSEPKSVIVVGKALSEKIKTERSKFLGINILSAYSDLEPNIDDIKPQNADILIYEKTTIDSSDRSDIDRLVQQTGVQHIAYVYSFGRKDDIESLKTKYSSAAKAPIEPRHIYQICRNISDSSHVASSLKNKIPEHIFSMKQLAKIGSAVSSIKCECPQHLSEIIYKLDAFETYCKDCKSQNVKDAAIHAQLHIITANARLMLEEGLEKLAKLEGIEY